MHETTEKEEEKDPQTIILNHAIPSVNQLEYAWSRLRIADEPYLR